MPIKNRIVTTRSPGTEWVDQSLRIWVVNDDGSLTKTGRFAPDPKLLAQSQVVIREREIELENWRSNIDVYADSTGKMATSAAQWRARAHELAPRVERPSQRWAWGVGGALIGFLLLPLLSPTPAVGKESA
jgi:hypothetical protein